MNKKVGVSLADSAECEEFSRELNRFSDLLPRVRTKQPSWGPIRLRRYTESATLYQSTTFYLAKWKTEILMRWAGERYGVSTSAELPRWLCIFVSSSVSSRTVYKRGLIYFHFTCRYITSRVWCLKQRVVTLQRNRRDLACILSDVLGFKRREIIEKR